MLRKQILSYTLESSDAPENKAPQLSSGENENRKKTQAVLYSVQWWHTILDVNKYFQIKSFYAGF